MVTVIYSTDTRDAVQAINAKLLHYGETALKVDTEQELFFQFNQGIDLLCLSSKHHALASFFSKFNHCMQVIFFPSRTSLPPIHCRNKNSFTFADIDKAIARSIQLKKNFYYKDNDREFILKKNILYVHKEKQRLKSSFHLCNSEVITLNRNFSDIIPYFMCPKFVISHPHYIVRLSKIKEVNAKSLTLINGEILPIADKLFVSI